MRTVGVKIEYKFFHVVVEWTPPRQKSRIKNLPLYDKDQTRVYIRAFHMDPAACMYLLCVFQVENVEAWLLNTMEPKFFEKKDYCKTNVPL